MKISDFLSPANVTVGAVHADKQKLLEEMARKAGAAVNVPADRILSELLKRETLGSTGVGSGVALPHARFPEIDKPLGMLFRLKKPIVFDAVDEKPVDTVFLLLLPEAGDQLGALAGIARKLRDKAVMTALRRARDGAEIYRIVTAD